MLVKGCTTARFWLMDFECGASDRRLSPVVTGPILTYCPVGRMNASAADRARAWFQGEDRLETARDRCESPHRHLCARHAGSHPERGGHRNYPDGADGDRLVSHRAVRAVRGGGVLLADHL